MGRWRCPLQFAPQPGQNTVLCRVSLPGSLPQYHTIPHSTTLYHIGQLYHTKTHSTTQYLTAHSTTQNHTEPHITTHYYTIPHSTRQYQYHTSWVGEGWSSLGKRGDTTGWMALCIRATVAELEIARQQQVF